MLPRAIVSVTLVCCACFLAQGVTQLIARAFPTLHRTPPPAAVSGEAALGELPPDALAILRRNIFDPSTGPLPRLALPVVQEPTRTTCEGPTRLVASIYSTHEPEWSFASLSTGTGSPLLYRVGSMVDGKRVDAVYPESVLLAQDGQYCLLGMFELRKQTQLPNTYQLQRSALYELFNSPVHAARVVPVEEAGRVIGVKLAGVRRDSILEKLGLKNGDVLRTVNGLEIATPDAALQAYAQLRSATQLTLAVIRRGVALTFEYRVE